MPDNPLFTNDRAVIPDKKKDFVAEIPRGLQSRQELFTALKHHLKLPNYFGYNWDALSECLRDLSWIKQRRVILIHHDVPDLTQPEIEEYADILATSSKYWSNSDQHELTVVRG